MPVRAKIAVAVILGAAAPSLALGQQSQISADDLIRALQNLPPADAARVRSALEQAGRPQGGAGGQPMAPQAGWPGGPAVGWAGGGSIGAPGPGGGQPQQSQGTTLPPLNPFDAAMSGVLPLDPDQVATFRRRLDATQRAAGTPPQPVRTTTASLQVGFEPGRTPPRVMAAANMATAINVFDATGAPWPIRSFVVGDPNRFSVIAPVPGGNMLTVTPLLHHGESNLQIVLDGAPAMVPITLSVGGTTAFQRADLQVDGLGPQASPRFAAATQSPVAGDSVMSSVLDGVPPTGAQTVRIEGGTGRAWRINGEIYLRTSATVLSPAYTSSASGAAGMNVFRLPDVPVVVISERGQTRRLTLRPESFDAPRDFPLVPVSSDQREDQARGENRPEAEAPGARRTGQPSAPAQPRTGNMPAVVGDPSLSGAPIDPRAPTQRPPVSR